jgi:hypothetical protein
MQRNAKFTVASNLKPLSGLDLGNRFKTVKFEEFGRASKTQKAVRVKILANIQPLNLQNAVRVRLPVEIRQKNSRFVV